MKKVLIWLYDQTVTASIRNILEERYEVFSAYSKEEMVSRLQLKNPDILFFDYNFFVQDLIALIKEEPERFRDVSFVHLIDSQTLDVNRHKLSDPFDLFLVKPYRSGDLDEVFSQLEERNRDGNVGINAFLDKFAGKKDYFQSLVAFSEKMQEVTRQGKTVAGNDIPVLLEGETGTGKTKLAEAIHHSGKRGEKPFISLNCSAIPENLLESELFGYKRGAFTGAYEDKKGKISEADGGTLFLDEIGDMPLALQPKLLKVLEDRSWFPLGGSKMEESDFRLICATNQKLLDSVKEGKFREDLYYRINIFPIKIPPLRERKDDIPVLAMKFLEEFKKKYSLNIQGFSKKYLEKISSQPWRGNIRELKNDIERSVLLNTGDSLAEKKEEVSLRSEPSISVDISLSLVEATNRAIARVEEEYLSKVLEQYKGKIVKAAEHAGVDRKTFREKLKKYNLDKNSFKK